MYHENERTARRAVHLLCTVNRSADSPLAKLRLDDIGTGTHVLPTIINYTLYDGLLVTRSTVLTVFPWYVSLFALTQINCLTHFISHVLICPFLIHHLSVIISPRQCHHHHSYHLSLHHSFIPILKFFSFLNLTLHIHLTFFRTDFTATRTRLRFLFLLISFFPIFSFPCFIFSILVFFDFSHFLSFQ